jgi:hypothetical protein
LGARTVSGLEPQGTASAISSKYQIFNELSRF